VSGYVVERPVTGPPEAFCFPGRTIRMFVPRSMNCLVM